MTVEYKDVEEMVTNGWHYAAEFQFGDAAIDTLCSVINTLCFQILEMSRNIEDLKSENWQLERTLEKSVDDLQDKIYHIESQLSDLRNS